MTPRSTTDDMGISDGAEPVAPVRSTGGMGTAGVLGGGVDSWAGELALEGEESGGWEAEYWEGICGKDVVSVGGI
jgi:hypothetical protein